MGKATGVLEGAWDHTSPIISLPPPSNNIFEPKKFTCWFQNAEMRWCLSLTKYLVFQHLILFNYRVKKHSVNRYNWNLQLVLKLSFAHSKQNSWQIFSKICQNHNGFYLRTFILGLFRKIFIFRTQIETDQNWKVTISKLTYLDLTTGIEIVNTDL